MWVNGGWGLGGGPKAVTRRFWKPCTHFLSFIDSHTKNANSRRCLIFFAVTVTFNLKPTSPRRQVGASLAFDSLHLLTSLSRLVESHHRVAHIFPLLQLIALKSFLASVLSCLELIQGA